MAILLPAVLLWLLCAPVMAPIIYGVGISLGKRCKSSWLFCFPLFYFGFYAHP